MKGPLVINICKITFSCYNCENSPKITLESVLKDDNN